MRYGQKIIPKSLWFGSALYLAYCFFFTPNFYLSILVIGFPIFAMRLFWLDNQPSVIFWGMLLQWATSATQLLYANALGVTLTERVKSETFPTEMLETATFLSVVGLYCFALGIYLVVRRVKFLDIDTCIKLYSPGRLLFFYMIFVGIIALTFGLIWAFPSIVQYIYALFQIKWGLFLVVFYFVHKNASHLKIYLYGIILIDLFLSATAFFARDIVFVSMFVLLGVIQLQPRLGFRTYFVLSLGAILIIHYLILWSAVKAEYRKFVSRGKKTQSVQVSPQIARQKYVELMTTVDAKKYQRGVEAFVDRIGYIQLFAASLGHVPKRVPHQGGKIYWSAIKHYTVPRFLNPEKEVLDDSKHASKYTGINLSGAKQATSISLGYIADAYVDFGRLYMFPILFFVGCLFGFCYRYIVKRCPDVLWVWMLSTPFLALVNINGTDTKKALGGLLIYFFTLFFLQNFFIKAVSPFIRSLR
jgi:hypothetical protein